MSVYEIPKKRGGFFSRTSLTTQLIIFNILVYIVVLILSAIYGTEKIFNFLALTPALVLSGSHLWTLLTSMFVHASFFHLFANMFSLFFVGMFLEKIIGKKRFFWLYLLSGIVGGVFFVAWAILFGDIAMPGVGASGAIFGLLGVLAVLVPYSKIYMIVGPLILIIVDVLLQGILPVSVLPTIEIFINILMIVMIISLFSFNSSFRKLSLPVELPMWLLPIVAIVPLTILGFFVEMPIGNSAHLGGLVAGLIYGFYLRKKFPNKTKRLERYFR